MKSPRILAPRLYRELPAGADRADGVHLHIGPANELIWFGRFERDKKVADTFDPTLKSGLIDRGQHYYCYLRVSENGYWPIEFPDNFELPCFIQPLPNDDLLLASSSTRFINKDDYDCNAIVTGPNFDKRREFLLGDGIQDVQVTSDGKVWTCYYDQGVFSDLSFAFDWYGARGIVCTDTEGKRLYGHTRMAGTDFIVDVYAMNVASKDETWFYYYRDFFLVRIHKFRPVSFWRCPIAGANAFAVLDNRVLFTCGYEGRNIVHLLRLEENEQMKLLDSFMVQSPSDRSPIDVKRGAYARGRYMYFVDGCAVYRLDVAEVE